MKYIWILAKYLRTTREVHTDQSRNTSASNFTKSEAPSQVFLKDSACDNIRTIKIYVLYTWY